MRHVKYLYFSLVGWKTIEHERGGRGEKLRSVLQKLVFTESVWGMQFYESILTQNDIILPAKTKIAYRPGKLCYLHCSVLLARYYHCDFLCIRRHFQDFVQVQRFQNILVTSLLRSHPLVLSLLILHHLRWYIWRWKTQTLKIGFWWGMYRWGS